MRAVPENTLQPATRRGWSHPSRLTEGDCQGDRFPSDALSLPASPKRTTRDLGDLCSALLGLERVTSSVSIGGVGFLRFALAHPWTSSGIGPRAYISVDNKTGFRQSTAQLPDRHQSVSRPCPRIANSSLTQPPLVPDRGHHVRLTLTSPFGRPPVI